jgi:transposase
MRSNILLPDAKETSMGRTQQYSVPLSEEERVGLLPFINKGKTGTRQLKRAHMVLLSSEGTPDREVAAALHASLQTVRNLRKKYAAGGLEAALHDRPRPGSARKLTTKGEATLIALACSAPPSGRPSWTMPLLADTLLELEVVDTISDETVRRTLKKTRASRGKKSSGAFAR